MPAMGCMRGETGRAGIRIVAALVALLAAASGLQADPEAVRLAAKGAAAMPVVTGTNASPRVREAASTGRSFPKPAT
jgi:hypothetical protein